MRRNTELGLLVLVVVITVAAFVLAGLGRDSTIPVYSGAFLAAVVLLLGVAHIVTRRLAPAADPTLLPMAALLNGLGFVVIARLNSQLAWQQATWTAFGVAAYSATLLFVKRPRDLDRYRWSFALAGLLLLLAPLVPKLGREINGARIWIGVGPFHIQPGELAKLCLIIFFASYLVEKRELLALGGRRIGPISLPELKHLGPLLVAWAASVLVMTMQKDLGQSLLLFLVFIVMLWVATQRGTYLTVGVGLFATASYLSWRAFEHVRTRVTIWIDPWQDPNDKGYQVLQGLFEMAAGGMGGTGLALSGRINIPEAENDFIFAVIAGELGLLGATAVIAAFLLIVGAGLRVATRATHPFDQLLATGLTVLVGFQAFIIIAGVTRLLPLTGVALPFVSYGGSALMSSYLLLALLMRISHNQASTAM